MQSDRVESTARDRELAKKFYDEEDDWDEMRDWLEILTRAIASARREGYDEGYAECMKKWQTSR